MILGTGFDLTALPRIKALLEKHGERFLARILTADELAALPAEPARRVAYAAGRWAAKEACAKALGTGFGAECGWKDIEVVKLPSGQPAIVLNGNAKETANKLGINRFHLSISHERHYATAVVIAEKDS